MPVVIGDLRNVAKHPDKIGVSFAAPVPRAGETPGSAISPYSHTVYPVAGILTTPDLEPGLCDITWAGKTYRNCELPDTATADFWQVIAPAVGAPPGTPAQAIRDAVAPLIAEFQTQLEELADAVGDKAALGHGHAIGEVDGLEAALAAADGELSPEERAALIDDTEAEVLDALQPPVDLVILFENALT